MSDLPDVTHQPDNRELLAAIHENRELLMQMLGQADSATKLNEIIQRLEALSILTGHIEEQMASQESVLMTLQKQVAVLYANATRIVGTEVEVNKPVVRP